MLVFYSATAWSRAQRAEGAADLRIAADLLERFAEDLRTPLLALVGALERARSENVTDDIDLVAETGEAAMRFATAVEQPMTTLRRALVLYDIDGMELLADLEDALARVREIAASLLAYDPA
jgi:signal transduction histidine kinase